MDNEREFIESLNRDQRRMIMRYTKYVSSGIAVDCNETARSVIGLKAQALLKTEKPFMLSIDSRESDIYMEATYLACIGLNKEELGALKSVFFDEMPLSELEKLDGIELEQDELEKIACLARRTGKENDFYTIYSMSRLCDKEAMQTALISLVSITIYELMKRTYSNKCTERAKNGGRRIPKSLAKVREEMLADIKPTPLNIEQNNITDKLKTLMMAKLLYWGGKKGLLDKAQFDEELNLHYKDSLSTFINVNLGSCGEYDKWVNNECTLYQSMVASGDARVLSLAEQEFTRQYLKNIRANIVCEYAFSHKLHEQESDIARLAKNNEEIKTKYQNAKKLRSEDLRKYKESTVELNKLKKQLEKQGRCGVSNAGELDELKQLVAKLETKSCELAEKIGDQSRINNALSEHNEGLIERVKVLETNLSESEIMCKHLTETLDELNQQEMNTDIPLEIVLKGISGIKLAICGGKEHIVSNLEKMGIQEVKHIPVGKIATAQEIGQFDCLVIVTKYVAHKSVVTIKEKAKSLGKIVLHFNGSNIELLCRQIFEETR